MTLVGTTQGMATGVARAARFGLAGLAAIAILALQSHGALASEAWRSGLQSKPQIAQGSSCKKICDELDAWIVKNEKNQEILEKLNKRLKRLSKAEQEAFKEKNDFDKKEALALESQDMVDTLTPKCEKGIKDATTRPKDIRTNTCDFCTQEAAAYDKAFNAAALARARHETAKKCSNHLAPKFKKAADEATAKEKRALKSLRACEKKFCGSD